MSLRTPDHKDLATRVASSIRPLIGSRRSVLRTSVIVAILLFVLLFADGLRQPAPIVIHSRPVLSSKIVNLTAERPFTHWDGGVPGYNVFSNLYLRGGTLMAVTPDADAAASIPEVRAVMSGPKNEKGHVPAASEDRWAVLHDAGLADVQLGKSGIRVPGITYIFNDPPGKEGYMPFYEHFLPELILPVARVIASVADEAGQYSNPRDLLPSRIIFPRCGPDPSWRDAFGHNVWFLQHALPDVIVEDATQWGDRAASDMPFIFEQVIVVDRASAHSAKGDTATWGKMNMIVPSLPAPTDFWSPFRENVLASVPNAMPYVGQYGLPVVVYLEKRAKPMLSQASHDALIAGLKDLTKRAEIHVVDLKTLSKHERIALLSRTSILVGLTQGDFIEAAWMRAGGGTMAIELFEEGGFLRDQEAFISMLNLEHMAIQYDEVLSEKMWRVHGRKRGPQKDGEIDVDGTLVARMVELQLNKIRKLAK